MRRILPAIAVILCLASCGKQEQPFDDDRQILRRGNGSELLSLDPHIITGIPEVRVLRSLFEGLVALDPHTLEPVPAAARSWERLDGGRLYRFRLDPDGRWSNGDPVTATDFADSFRRILSGSLGAPYASQLFVIRNARAHHAGELAHPESLGVRAVDDLTLEIELERPVPYFLSLLVNPAWFPVHRPSVESVGAWLSRNAEWTRPGALVTNGPYRLADWRLNDFLRVDRNPHFRDPGAFPLDEIYFFPISNLYAEERAFLDGLIDVTSIVSPQRIRYYLESDDPSVLQVEPDLGVYYLILNTRVPPLDDPRVRRALGMALNRSAISRDIRRRGEPVARHFTPPGIGGYQPPPVFREDPAEAARLLREAGYGPENPLELPYLFNTSETHRPIAEAIQSIWKERLGLDIRLVNKEWKSYLSDRRNRDFTIARAGWLGDYLDPDTFLGLWTSESTNNFSGWSHPEYDRLMAEAAALPSGPARNDLLRKAETILLEEAPILPVFFYNRAYLRAPRVENWPTNILGYTNYAGIRIGGQE